MSARHLARVRRICRALPGTTERLSHGAPTFFALNKKVYVTFVSHHHGDAHVEVWLPAPPGVQASLIESDPKSYFRPPYVGGAGWVGIELGRITEPALRFHIQSAWELIVPARLRPVEAGPIKAPRPARPKPTPTPRSKLAARPRRKRTTG